MIRNVATIVVACPIIQPDPRRNSETTPKARTRPGELCWRGEIIPVEELGRTHLNAHRSEKKDAK